MVVEVTWRRVRDGLVLKISSACLRCSPVKGIPDTLWIGNIHIWQQYLASGIWQVNHCTGARLRLFSKTHLSKISPTLSLLVSQAGWVQRSFTIFHRSLLLPTSEGHDRGGSPGVEKSF